MRRRQGRYALLGLSVCAVVGAMDVNRSSPAPRALKPGESYLILETVGNAAARPHTTVKTSFESASGTRILLEGEQGNWTDGSSFVSWSKGPDKENYMRSCDMLSEEPLVRGVCKRAYVNPVEDAPGI